MSASAVRCVSASAFVPRALADQSTYDPSAGARRRLDAVFNPQSIAVIGATDRVGSVGAALVRNLLDSPYQGEVYPISLSRKKVFGHRAYPDITAVDHKIDLAMIVVPAGDVAGVVADCSRAGVQAAVIVSAGFRETGTAGRRLEEEVKRAAGGMRFLGPNSLGVIRPSIGLNASFIPAEARPGNVALISQSGALLASILDWSRGGNVGFSSVVSAGSMTDVGWGELINHLGNDPETSSILLYVESISSVRNFLSAAREVALQKPIIVLKGGRTEGGATAARSHTGALIAADDVVEAAFRRVGVLRVDGVADLFYAAEVLAKQPRPRGRRLTVITNAGGPGVLAADALISGGGRLAPLPNELVEELAEMLPRHWSRGNPIDIIGNASPDRYERVLQATSRLAESDGTLIIFSPQMPGTALPIAERVAELTKKWRRPVLACWMGGMESEPARRVLNDAGIPTFDFPDTAARVFNYMWRYRHNLRALYETPMPAEDLDYSAAEQAKADIDAVAREGRTVMSEYESRRILRAYGIDALEVRRVTSAEEAASEADAIGYPVVLKLDSQHVIHKSDVGGVELNLGSADAVRHAFNRIRERVISGVGAHAFDGVIVEPMIRGDGVEMLIGSSTDESFGPVLAVGTGGRFVEVHRDRALALPPLTTTLGRRAIERTRIGSAIQSRGWERGMIELERLMVRLGRLVIDIPRIKEIDINPIHVGPNGVSVLDASVILHPSDRHEADLPSPVIRPYPQQYVGPWTLRDGRSITIRPIRPEDEPLMTDFHQHLSDQSVYMRYAGALQLRYRITHDRLARICFNDYDREIALVAVHHAHGRPEILAVARMTKLYGSNTAEIAFIIRDRDQRLGLGGELLDRLIRIARDEDIGRLVAEMLIENRGMRKLLTSRGFEIEVPEPGDQMISAVLTF